jgi:hypothetical protein
VVDVGLDVFGVEAPEQVAGVELEGWISKVRRGNYRALSIGSAIVLLLLSLKLNWSDVAWPCPSKMIGVVSFRDWSRGNSPIWVWRLGPPPLQQLRGFCKFSKDEEVALEG